MKKRRAEIAGDRTGTTRHRILPVAIMAGMAMATLLGQTVPAHALSCQRPDIVRSYERWHNSDSDFIIVRGTLTPLEELPRPQQQQNPNQGQQPKPVRYHFSGVNIQKNGNATFEAEVTIAPKCLGNWCGPYPRPTGPVVTALTQLKPGHFILRPGPCPGDFFTGNMPELEQSLRNCMKGVACKPEKGNAKPIPAFKPPVTIQLR